MRIPPWTLTILLALTLLTAGCLGTDDRPLEQAADAGGTGDAPPNPGAETAPPDEVDFPVSWRGKTVLGACVPSGPNACLSFLSGDARHEPTFSGEPVHASLTLTWSAQTPATAELQLALFRVTSCGENGQCHIWIDGITGTSPLALDVSDIALEDGESLRLSVERPGLFAQPVYAKADLEQAFDVTGTITALV